MDAMAEVAAALFSVGRHAPCEKIGYPVSLRLRLLLLRDLPGMMGLLYSKTQHPHGARPVGSAAINSVGLIADVRACTVVWLVW